MDHFSATSKSEKVYFNILKFLPKVPSHLDLKIKKSTLGQTLVNIRTKKSCHGFPWIIAAFFDFYFCNKLKNRVVKMGNPTPPSSTHHELII